MFSVTGSNPHAGSKASILESGPLQALSRVSLTCALRVQDNCDRISAKKLYMSGNVDGWHDLHWSNKELHIVASNQTKWRRYPTTNDFGSEIIPWASKDYNVQAYLFNGYWEDIRTIKSFFDANLALTDQPPKFHFYDPLKPIFTSPRFLPPSKIEKCHV